MNFAPAIQWEHVQASLQVAHSLRPATAIVCCCEHQEECASRHAGRCNANVCDLRLRTALPQQLEEFIRRALDAWERRVKINLNPPEFRRDLCEFARIRRKLHRVNARKRLPIAAAAQDV